MREMPKPCVLGGGLCSGSFGDNEEGDKLAQTISGDLYGSRYKDFA